MQTKIIIKINDDLNNIKSQWESLYCKYNLSVFQSYEWTIAWFKEYGIDHGYHLFIIQFIEKDNIVGIFPLFIDKKKILRFIGDSLSDQCDFLIDYSNIDLYKIGKLFFNIIDEYSKDINAIEFNNLSINNKLIPYFETVKYRESLHFSSNTTSFTRLIKNNQFPYNIKNLNSYVRNELNRIYKKYSNFSNKIFTIADNPFPISTISVLKNIMILNKTRNKKLLNVSFLKIIEYLYNNNLIIINAIYDENDALALNIITVTNDYYMFYIDLYKDIKYINLYSYIKFIKTISENSELFKENISFGRGLYSYKIKNFKPIPEYLYTYIYSNRKLLTINNLKYISSFMLYPIYKRIKNIINKTKTLTKIT
jgi:hypothetical protein